MQPTLIDQGLNLMLYGMGTVFVFLTVLVFATVLMSRMVRRFAPEDIAATKPAATPGNAPSPAVVEAIKLAIAKHRQG